MIADRRSVLFGLGLLLATGCASARKVGVPPLMLDPVRWRAYRASFLLPEGRIVDSGNAGVSHTEGQGFGLFFAQAAGDKAAFDAMLRWTEATLARGDVALFSWRYVPGAADPVPDRNNASDGDLLIAWALECAGRKWGEAAYLRRSAQIRAALARHLVVKSGGMTLLLPAMDGFEKPDHVTVNPSYYVWPALDAFAALDASVWRPVVQDGLTLLARDRFGKVALPADWVDVDGEGKLSLAADHPPRFGFEAVRIPAYLLLSGRRQGLEAIKRYWGAAGPVPAWIDLKTGEVAPYPLSPGGQAVAARVTGRPYKATGADRDYYSATLGLLASMVRP
jgi:endoglucanase